MDKERIVDSEDEVPFNNLDSESNVLISNEESNDATKSDGEEHFEFLKEGTNHTVRIVSMPAALQDLDMKASWTSQKTKALIEEYRKMLQLFRDPEKKLKDLWIELANNMRTRGFRVTWQMCDRKFRNLKQTYRTIYYSERSEISKRRWEFYDDLSTLITPHGIRRPSTSPSHRHRTHTAKLSTICEDMMGTPQHETEATVYRDTYMGDSDETMTSNSAPDWFQKFLVQFKNDQENFLIRLQSMHNELKQIELRKVRLLETICSMLENHNDINLN